MRITFYFRVKQLPNIANKIGQVLIEIEGKIGAKKRKKYIDTGYGCKLDTYKIAGENTVYWSQESKSFVASKKNIEGSRLANSMNREIMRMITKVIDIQEKNQFLSPDDLFDAYERSKTSETLAEVYDAIMIRKTLAESTARVYISIFSWAMGAAIHLTGDTEPSLDMINTRTFCDKLFDYVSKESPKYQWKIDPNSGNWDLFQATKKKFTFTNKVQIRGWYNMIINHAFENMLIPHKLFRLPIDNQKEPGRKQKERLSSQELKKLINYPYSKTCPDIYQDVFTLCCLTGMSYVDVRKLSASEIIENKGTHWIEKSRSKTDTNFVMYLIEPAKDIVYKYLNKEKTKEKDGMLFWQLSENTMIMNHHLKKFAKVFFSEFPRTKAISSHVGRHTFTQIHSEIGTPNQVIADMMGWKMGTIVDTYRAVVRKNVYNSMESFWDYIRDKKPTDEFDF